jgi:choline/ethanolamine kinase
MLLSACCKLYEYLIFLWQIPIIHTGKQPSEDEAELLLQEVEKYTLASHVFWGLWGIISVSIQHIALSLSFTSMRERFHGMCFYLLQGYVNKIEFDYMEYARQRFQQYWMRKQELLASSDKAPDNHVDGYVVYDR